MSYYSNYYRTILSNTLRISHRASLFICSPHLSRRKLRMNYSIHSRKRRIYILLIPIYPHRPRNLLRLIQTNRNMKYRSYSIYLNHSNSLHRICTTMRTNKILRSNSYYQPIFCHPIYRKNSSRVNMRWICSRQCYT